MTNTRELRVIANSIGFKKLAKDADLVVNKFQSLNQVMAEVEKRLGINKGTLAQKDVKKMMGLDTKTKFDTDTGMILGGKNQANAVKKSVGQLKEFRMEYLSTMFFGMQMWRTFGGIFRSMLDSYKKLDEKGNRPLNKSITKLQASLEFLKFSIMDAMGLSFINAVTHFLIDGVIWRLYRVTVWLRNRDKCRTELANNYKYWVDPVFGWFLGFDQLLHYIVVVVVYGVGSVL